MALYFLHVRDGTNQILDPEGDEIATREELYERLMRAARELMICGIERGVLDLRFRIDAEDIDGTLIYSLPFRHAVTIVPEVSGAASRPVTSAQGNKRSAAGALGGMHLAAARALDGGPR